MATPAERDDFLVLLLGGNGGVGKTTLAPKLAVRLGMAWGSVDDYRLVIERVTTPSTHPALHHFFQTLGSGESREAAVAYRAVGQIVSEALEIVIANHVATAVPIVLEGDTLVPGVAAQHRFAGLAAGRQARAVFLVEPDAKVIAQQLWARGRGALDDAQLAWHAQFSAHYGQWLQQEAQAHGLPVVARRPYDTLVERTLTVLRSSLEEKE